MSTQAEPGPMNPSPPGANPPRPSLAERISTTRLPWLVLTLSVTLMYAPTLFHPFMLDDYRNVALCEEFAAGARPSLDLYGFAVSTPQVIAERRNGDMPWWVFDDFRFQYLRPLTEWTLYGEFKLFGRWVTGYRIFGLLLYILCVQMAYRLYRAWLGDESLARWSAMIFGMAASNAVPVVFIAAQCDLLALASCLGAMLCVTRFVRGDGIFWAPLGMLCYALGMVSKEAALPTCILPVTMLPLMLKRYPLRRSPIKRRVATATALLVTMALAFVAYHSMHGYGSNGVLLLNPIHEPLKYLKLAPMHILMLLSSWITQANPIITYLHGRFVPAIVAFCVVGAIALAGICAHLWRYHRHHAALPSFGLWALAFMPLLACTNPDNRVLMLPMVGLAVITGVWLTGRTGVDPDEAATPVRHTAKLPTVLFLMVAGAINGGTGGALRMVEIKSAQIIHDTTTDEQDPVTADDTVFMINTAWQFDLLWCQYRADYLLGDAAPHMRYLTHLPHVTPQRLDDHTLRITSNDAPFFGPFLGRLGMTSDQVPDGMTFDAGEFVASIAARDADGEVTAIDFRFREPLTSARYRFFELSKFDPPRRMDWSNK